MHALLPLWLPWARRRLRRYGRSKPGTLLKHHIPLKTDLWEVSVPGFTEIDLVAHCGNLGEGEFVHSLNLTDIPITWVETAAVLGKRQRGVQAALEELRQAQPFRLKPSPHLTAPPPRSVTSATAR